MLARRRWGYLVWAVAGVVIAVPELTAAVDKDALGVITISETVGHLERRWSWVELIVVAAIVFALFSTVRVPPHRRPAKRTSSPPKPPATSTEDDTQPGRTHGGRLTLRPPTRETPTTEFDAQDAPLAFVVAALLSFAAVAAATLAAIAWWDDKHHYHPSYVLYGLLGLLWLIVPSLVAFASGKDVPFPTLFRTVANFEEWLRVRPWPLSLGPVLGWLVAYVILAGLVILLLHLTLYPYPDITHILNPNG